LNWPGNVRQLENFCRWITVMASSREIQINDLPPEFSAQEVDRDNDGSWTHALESWADHQLSQGNSSILDQATPLFERTLIDIALKHTAGRRRDAANLLGWGRNTLTRKIKELGPSTVSPE
jgi:two-component system nitrogen regulation response regulator GlnG